MWHCRLTFFFLTKAYPSLIDNVTLAKSDKNTDYSILIDLTFIPHTNLVLILLITR